MIVQKHIRVCLIVGAMLFFSFGSSSAGCNFSWDYNPVMAFDNISGTGKVIVRERICSVTLKSGDSLDVNA